MVNKRCFLYASFLLGLLWSIAIAAAPTFPALSGRVVDDAHLLSPDAIQQLDRMLAEQETATTNQVVVVTIPSLNGYPIEDYGYQLGRHWQIGQKGKNNGVLLIVAPIERKARIEVGYGLEPILTDALSSEIIQSIILPRFKQGNYQQGILDGTKGILDVLGGKHLVKPPKKKTWGGWGWIFFMLAVLLFIRNPGLAFLIFSGSGDRFGGGSSGGDDSDGGGFSGGGSFGGGGASGSW